MIKFIINISQLSIQKVLGILMCIRNWNKRGETPMHFWNQPRWFFENDVHVFYENTFLGNISVFFKNHKFANISECNRYMYVQFLDSACVQISFNFPPVLHVIYFIFNKKNSQPFSLVLPASIYSSFRRDLNDCQVIEHVVDV